jgi:hypothetical protein
VRYTDPSGKWIAGTDGKPVTYQDGKWSENTSQSVQRVGNAMLRTNAGTKHLNEMLSPSTQKILIEINSEIKNEGGNKVAGLTSTKAGKDADGNLVVQESKITIYEGSIKELTSEKAGDNQFKGMTMEDAISVVAGHEKGHTEKENIKQSYENEKEGAEHDVEARPIEIEKEIIDEINKKR